MIALRTGQIESWALYIARVLADTSRGRVPEGSKHVSRSLNVATLQRINAMSVCTIGVTLAVNVFYGRAYYLLATEDLLCTPRCL